MTDRTEDAAMQEFTLSRVFDAPRHLVYRVWTDPKYVALWWGIEGATNVRCELDVRPGGAWRIDMRTAGGTVYPNGGVFLEVIANERLVYNDLPTGAFAEAGAAPGARLNTVLFEDDKSGGTRVSLTIRAESAAACQQLLKQGMREGIGQALDRLSRLLCKLYADSDPRSVKGGGR